MSIENAAEAIEEMATIAQEAAHFETRDQLVVYIGHSVMLMVAKCYREGHTEMMMDVIIAYANSRWFPDIPDEAFAFARRMERGELTEEESAAMRDIATVQKKH